jgi:5-methylcytosine-specific restriction endonuclease McrA
VCRRCRELDPKRRARHKRYRQSEKWKAWAKRYSQTPQSKAVRRRIEQKRRGAQLEKLQVVYVYFRDKARCHLCGKLVKPEDISLDHLVPVADGGPATYANVKLAHRLCNSLNGTGRMPAQFLLFG